MSIISRNGVSANQRIRSQQLLNVIDALDGTTATDIVINGNLTGAIVPSITYHVSPNHVGLSSPYFTTIPSALASAVSGSLVVVHPGTYQSNVVLKNGVDIFCYPNVILRNDNTNVPNAAGCVITDNRQSVSCSVLGYADIIKSDAAVFNEAAAIGIYGDRSNVLIEARLVYSDSWSAFIVGCTGTMSPTRPSATLHADRVVGLRHIACDCDTADMTVYAREIVSYQNCAVWCMTTGGIAVERKARQTIYADNITLQSAFPGVPAYFAVWATGTGSVIETHGNITTNTNQAVVAYTTDVSIRICDGVVRNTWNDPAAYCVYTQPYSGRQALVSLRNVALITDYGTYSINADPGDAGYVLAYGDVSVNRAENNIFTYPGNVIITPITTDMF